MPLRIKISTHVDLPLLRLAARVSGELHVPVTDPVHFIEEISQWMH
jgi:hypothetical protein